MLSSCPSLTIIVPCYNEEDVLPETARRLDLLLAQMADSGRIAADSHVDFVDDGSKDRTWALIQKLRESSSRFGGVKLSRNCGHQNALMTGLLAARGDVLITVDADLQDDLNAIDDMLRAAVEGADIVYGVRRARERDTAMKRLTAHLYYRLLQFLKVEIVFDHADYRLMTRRAVDALRQYEESNLFLRALIPQLGFKTSIVTYERNERFAGTSKYSLRKMLALAIDGVTSFSTQPLRIATILGLCISFVALILTLWALFSTLVLRAAIPGWASTVVPIYLISGVQLLCIGIMGEYLGKIYLETKRRPRAHVAEMLESRAPDASAAIPSRSHEVSAPDRSVHMRLGQGFPIR
jgi:glycosyltransferase involved in cell wall biosynthesis